MKKPTTISIVIANHKGGVGKTTTAITLATGLATLEYPVVLVDCDGQGNVAHFLHLEERPALYELVIQEKQPESILQQKEGYQTLGIITGNQDTLEIEDALNRARRIQIDTALINALAPFAGRNGGRPTIIIVDTAPSLSNIQVAALYAADWLLIPAIPEYASENGLIALVETVDQLQENGAHVQLMGILPTLVDSRSNEHRETVLALRDNFPGLVLPPVRRLVALGEAPGRGLPIWEYERSAAQDYAKVLNSVMRRIGLS